MKKAVAAEAPKEFEPEFVAGLKGIFEEMITFNQVLGLKITSITPERVSGAIAMRPELVGSPNRIHGGVISASLDAMGGRLHVRSVYEDRQGRLWMGNNGIGVLLHADGVTT